MENDQTRPNLFTYATSELSQDAFICWLAAWADPKWKEADPDLHKIGLKFVLSLIHKEKSDYDLVNIKTVDVKRQVEKLDILIEVNKKDLDSKLAVLVEDKTHTSNHSDQLNRYYKQVKDSGYDISQMIPLYFKTGYQSKFDTLGIFRTYLRSDFLTVLREGKGNGIDNAIYTDFLAHLENMEFVVNQYWTKNLLTEDGKSGWGENDWRGFFIHLYKNRSQLYNVTDDDTANWSYIANPSGGFFGFWWYFKKLAGGFYTPYLQLENDSLCFKIKVDDETKRSKAREEAYYKLKEVNTEVERPKRMGNGLYMTVARGKGDYRKTGVNDKLDFDATLENLKKAQQILDIAFPQ